MYLESAAADFDEIKAVTKPRTNDGVNLLDSCQLVMWKLRNKLINRNNMVFNPVSTKDVDPDGKYRIAQCSSQLTQFSKYGIPG